MLEFGGGPGPRIKFDLNCRDGENQVLDSLGEPFNA